MEQDANVLGAISRGTVDGLHLALNVAAMLISFIALIYLVDGCFDAVHGWLAHLGMPWFPTSVEEVFGPDGGFPDCLGDRHSCSGTVMPSPTSLDCAW